MDPKSSSSRRHVRTGSSISLLLSVAVHGVARLEPIPWRSTAILVTLGGCTRRRIATRE